MFLLASTQDQESQDDGENPDGDIDGKDGVPIKRRTQVPPKCGTESRGYQERDTHHGGDHRSLGRREFAIDDRKGDGHQGTTADALKHAEHDQQFFGWCECTEGRSERKKHQRR